jgi:methionyl-tRNA formyltransferase
VRTVYLGTSDFAVAVLDRLADSPHRPVLVVTRPDRPKGRGRKWSPPPVAERAKELGIDLIQPDDLHAPETLERIAAAEPDALVVCAYGALVKEPLLSDYEILNVHPSLLPRWRGAAPIERAIMAGDERTGVAIMRLTAGLDSGPVCLMEEEPIRQDDDFGTLAARLERKGGDLLVRAFDERPAFTEQSEDGVTYAEKITARDRNLDVTRPPEYAERTVRALRPHIGARIPLPDGAYLGVWAARVTTPPTPTLAPAGGRLRREGGRLFLDCNGGALELLEVQPPGGRRMPSSEWLRGRPDPALTDFWMDPALPDQDLDTLVERAVEEWNHVQEWAPHLAALCWRGTQEVLDAMCGLASSEGPERRCVAAYVLGQLGIPTRTFAEESDRILREMAAAESDPRVLATIAHAFGNLGDRYGTDALLALRDHPDAGVRDGVARALSGRREERAIEALMALSSDPDAEIRDWATFALGALADRDTPELREALAARLADEDEAARVEAIHGLALRADPRAVGPALELLEAGRHRTQGPWHGHALEEAAIRLAALSGDARFAAHLPPVDRYAGTTLEHDLRLAHERLAAAETA